MKTPAMPAGPCNIYSDEEKKKAFACVHLCPGLGFKMEPELYDTEALGFLGRQLTLCLGQMSH